MPQQGYSIGRDITLAVIIPGGTVLRLGKVTKFSSKQDMTKQKIKPINGVNDTLRFIEGWTGDFELERRYPDLDQYFAQIEANYFADADEQPVVIQQTITEPSGQVTQWRYERVILSYDDAGSWESDKSVGQKVSFDAARRIQQA